MKSASSGASPNTRGRNPRLAFVRETTMPTQPLTIPQPVPLTQAFRSASMSEWWAAPVTGWKLTLVGAAASAVAAWAMATQYGQNFWQVEGTLIHTPLPGGEHLGAIYVPPSPQTLITLVKSPRSLEAVARELELPVSPRTVDRCLKVVKPYNADSVSLVLEWPDPDAGRRIVDRLMDLHAAEVASLRSEKVKEGTALLKDERVRIAARLDELRAAYAELPGAGNPERLRTDWEFAKKELSALSIERDVLRGEVEQYAGKIATAQEREKAIVARSASEAEAFDPDDANAPYVRRKEILVDALREDEHRYVEAVSALAIKDKELQLLKPLHAKGVLSQLEYDRAAGEVELHAVKKRNAERAVAQRRKELAELPLQQLQADRVELDRQKGRAEAKLAVVEQTLAAKRKAADEQTDVIAKEAKLHRQILNAEDDLRSIEVKIATMTQLGGDTVREFAVAQPATSSPHPTASNRKSIAALTFGGMMAFLCLGQMGYARVKVPRTVPPALPTFGLPVLAACEPAAVDPGSVASAPSDEARQLALRLRAPVRQCGGLVVFTSAAEDVPYEDVACQLARYLALWEESVLILDARIDGQSPRPLNLLFEAPQTSLMPAQATGELVVSHPPADQGQMSGLFHYLHSADEVEENRYVRKTAIDRVDCMPVGDAFPSSDLLASSGMHRLLVRLSQQYDRILIIAPALTQPFAVEILTGYADGVVVAVRAGEPERPDPAAAMRAVQQSGVPLAGVMVRT